MPTPKNPHAVALGRKGGSVKSPRKLAALAKARKLRWPQKKTT